MRELQQVMAGLTACGEIFGVNTWVDMSIVTVPKGKHFMNIIQTEEGKLSIYDSRTKEDTENLTAGKALLKALSFLYD